MISFARGIRLIIIAHNLGGHIEEWDDLVDRCGDIAFIMSLVDGFLKPVNSLTIVAIIERVLSQVQTISSCKEKDAQIN